MAIKNKSKSTKILKENDKFNIKVISPNFKLKYNMGLNEIEERLEKLIKYSNPNKDLKPLSGPKEFLQVITIVIFLILKISLIKISVKNTIFYWVSIV